ncbi:hydroxyisourate hydrolase [Neobacillus muris]|uniref:hydroxyisourate hydrolase n=1 Tax=Neobacillus muris TaxID=2941334 RepID=UPI00204158F7|nr:hydroxyisourate hydrolase [Neobacillus muris]
MTGLTTHVLDLTHGIPAANVTIDLYFQEDHSLEWKHIKTAVTNADGRLDHPLLTEAEMKIGNYELLFHIGNYYRGNNIDLHHPLFLDKIPVRFGLANKNVHYHVPLLVSPFGYQVYRGS